MIRRDDYDDQSWQELLARCKLLTKGHEWEPGDMGYDPKSGILGWAWKSYIIGEQWVLSRLDGLSKNGDQYGIVDVSREIGNWIWIPRLDQLVRMEPIWELGFNEEDWFIRNPRHPLTFGPTPELTALRALQNCDDGKCETCLEENRQLREKEHPQSNAHMLAVWGPFITIDFAKCAGIHPPDGPHRCLSHVLVAVEVSQ